MIKVEKLSFGFPSKDIYKNVTFSVEKGKHCALIGSNGTGKTTLIDMIINPDKYIYDGLIKTDASARFGVVSQFAVRDKHYEGGVFDYLSECFITNRKEVEKVCEDMASAENMEELFERYQKLLDEADAMDCDNYESNIYKQLYEAGMRELADTQLSMLSGGEYKLLQVMREMLTKPDVLIMDEPDAFLDFHNLNRLCRLINSYKGTMLVITHNRYVLNHCFDKILHLENCDIQEFDGSFNEYRCRLMQEKLRLLVQRKEEQEEIERNEKMVAAMQNRASAMANASLGRAVGAKHSQLERLKARQIKAPFIEMKEPEIVLPEVDLSEVALSETVLPEAALQEIERGDRERKPVLRVTDYNVTYDANLLNHVDFEVLEGEKAAIVGANGTGKTTIIRDILSKTHPSIHIDEDVEYACLSQFYDESVDDKKTVYEIMQDAGFTSKDSMAEYLSKYCFDSSILDSTVRNLSGGEQNMLQIALIGVTKAKLLVLDEPTSHLDIYAQAALERAVREYKGAVVCVSHDFYFVANCADYVLMVEDNGIRRMRSRTFRKLVYDKYFDVGYLEKDRRRQELEDTITKAFKKGELQKAEKLCSELEELSLNTK